MTTAAEAIAAIVGVRSHGRWLRSSARTRFAPIALSLLLFAMAPWAGAARFAYVANYFGNTVSVIDVAANNVVATIPVAAGPKVVTVNAAGTRVYVGHSDPLSLGNGGSLSVIDTATNTVVANIFGLGAVGQVIVEPSDALVYVVSGVFTFSDYFITLMDASTNTVVSTISGKGFPGRMAIDPTGSRAYVVVDGSVLVLDAVSNTSVTTIDSVASSVSGVAVFDPFTSHLYVPDGFIDELHVLDTVTNTLKTNVTVGQQPKDVVVNPAGTRIYVMNWGSDSVSVVDGTSLSVVATIPLGGVSPISLTMNPTNHFLYVLIHNVGPSTLAVIDTEANAVVANVSTNSDSVAVHPDGTRIYTSEIENFVAVREASSGAVIAKVRVGDTPMGIALGPEIAVPFPMVTAVPTLTNCALAALVLSISALVVVASNLSERHIRRI